MVPIEQHARQKTGKAQGTWHMKTKRWMKTVLNEANKEQIEMPWSRKLRLARRAENPQKLVAAE
jgi:hypothetical protein